MTQLPRRAISRVLVGLPLLTWAGCGVSPVLPDAGTDAQASTPAGSDGGPSGSDGAANDASRETSASDAAADDDADSEDVRLFGTIGSSLVRIDTTTGAATVVGPLGLAPIIKLAFHEGNQQLYGVFDYLKMPKLVVIDACSGKTTLIAPLTISGGVVHFVGGLDYNPTDGKLYATVSLDGAYPAEGVEEHLVTVDTQTGVLTSVGEIRDGVALVDGDYLAFSPGTKLVIDGDPNDGGSDRLWNLSAADAAASNVRSAPGVLGWIEFHKGVFYGTVFTGAMARSLVTVDPSTGALTVIGPTHGPTDFGGEPIVTLSQGLCRPGGD